MTNPKTYFKQSYVTVALNLTMTTIRFSELDPEEREDRSSQVFELMEH